MLRSALIRGVDCTVIRLLQHTELHSSFAVSSLQLHEGCNRHDAAESGLRAPPAEFCDKASRSPDVYVIHFHRECHVERLRRALVLSRRALYRPNLVGSRLLSDPRVILDPLACRESRTPLLRPCPFEDSPAPINPSFESRK